jgi:hypothetical protein
VPAAVAADVRVRHVRDAQAFQGRGQVRQRDFNGVEQAGD